ncbi:putative NAD(P)H quinone oxidoreductase, PIG3 family [Bosea sp. 62]|uniref:NAD(P)H-quinone oxidoreductase n=1 Tax=unclassified Bosea (in: a-proteobacteria) TaxID=2653178 RepID=UPI0012557815|nr:MULTISPECIES: NAD(P)H-quinone oxidoreductase [unclassified Bosea (in: a-proteobacteria)]CAD5248640.1 putative NAD(P)H quinone oxidoreductase, PIG3 family [Bosea sp. 46]CAD5249845.1 putative NAD(P)H quinone oxidoreductase, PIG3 family [Bosea sp. 21B]CAD5266146.1 putative NAD(P)H quinone oxidoreductase, PIG3 family [Bosea sp. 7B]VVT44775.1 putative NAD(P)H quinone oxidoreductase, PIG3 family [Bosea sp. EC-HK365B]VXB04042.1 putative NAD(P)H quinone oxidoreductase, PIG3 family [Bosea sp. 29B]
MTALPATMTAIGFDAPGGPDVLKPQQRPVPQPGPGQVLVHVAVAGVNRPDVLQRMGGYAPPPGASDIPGLEIAGRIVALGEGVSRYEVGDQVCALVAGGGYAEYAVVHEDNALPIPSGLSLEEAGALPETYFTVWTNVFQRGGLKKGESFMVHGGTSGIGTTAIQLAKAFGATVLATAGSDEKCAACRDLGADHAINYRTEDFVAAAKAATGGRGVNLILDMVGGDYINRNYDAAAESGRIVQIAFLNGPKAEVDFRRLMMKRLTHTGSTLRPRTIAEKAAIARELEDKVWPLLTEGRCKPVIHARFPLAQAAQAHALMESNAHIGKIVLTI